MVRMAMRVDEPRERFVADAALGREQRQREPLVPDVAGVDQHMPVAAFQHDVVRGQPVADEDVQLRREEGGGQESLGRVVLREPSAVPLPLRNGCRRRLPMADRGDAVQRRRPRSLGEYVLRRPWRAASLRNARGGWQSGRKIFTSATRSASVGAACSMRTRSGPAKRMRPSFCTSAINAPDRTEGAARTAAWSTRARHRASRRPSVSG